MITIPEITLKRILDAVLQKIQDDYNSETDKSRTFLHNMFNGVQIGIANYLQEAVRIFVRDGDDPRVIETTLMFDRERTRVPTVHITIPQSTPYGDGIGYDLGYTDDIKYNNPATEFTQELTRSFRSNFELVITGANQNEVLIIYYALMSALIVNVEGLEMNGFRNPILSGKEFFLREDISPNGYARVITLSSFAELSVPRFNKISIISSVEFEGTPYDD